MAEKPKRGFCDTCGKTFRLLPGGKIPNHTTPGGRFLCGGSNLPPGEALEAAQHELVLDELWLDCDDWIEAA